MDFFLKRLKELEKKQRTNTAEDIEIEIVSSYGEDEFLGFGNFDKFFDQIDIDNSQTREPEDWEKLKERGIRDTYLKVYLKLLDELNSL